MPEEQLEELLHDPFEAAMPAYLPYLPDDGLVSEGELQLRRLGALADRDSDACARYARTWHLPPEIAALLPRDLLAARQDIAASAMAASLDGGRPRQPAPPQDGTAAGGWPADCRDAERLLRDLLDRPPEEAGPLLLALLGG